ncbi:MAG: hydrophobic protein [Actinomycetota bacterium]
MVALLALIVILALFGAGAAVHVLWWIAIAAIVLWVVGWMAHGPEGRWYRW